MTPSAAFTLAKPAAVQLSVTAPNGVIMPKSEQWTHLLGAPTALTGRLAVRLLAVLGESTLLALVIRLLANDLASHGER